ncbi:hypothetical protein ACH4MG_26920 [Streptomyces sp. NPDC017454]
MEAVFIVGVITGATATLVTRWAARRAWERLENWLAGKVQSLAAKKLN